jgi:hypothetical protein
VRFANGSVNEKCMGWRIVDWDSDERSLGVLHARVSFSWRVTIWSR